MIVSGLDHINIATPALEETVAFYEAALGLTRDASPIGPGGAWMRDAKGNAIVHLMTTAEGGRDLSTGAVHHVAFLCGEHDAAVDRLRAMGVDFEAGTLPELRQLFVRDPNGVMLELNFPGD